MIVRKKAVWEKPTGYVLTVEGKEYPVYFSIDTTNIPRLAVKVGHSWRYADTMEKLRPLLKEFVSPKTDVCVWYLDPYVNSSLPEPIKAELPHHVMADHGHETVAGYYHLPLEMLEEARKKWRDEVARLEKERKALISECHNRMSTVIATLKGAV